MLLLTLYIQKFISGFTIVKTVHPIFPNFKRIYRNILNVAIFLYIFNSLGQVSFHSPIRQIEPFNVESTFSCKIQVFRSESRLLLKEIKCSLRDFDSHGVQGKGGVNNSEANQMRLFLNIYLLVRFFI